MKIIGLVAAGVMLASAGAAQAQSREGDWRHVGSTSEFQLAVDASTIHVSGSTRRYWTVAVPKVPAEEDYGLMLTVMDCDEGTHQILQGTTYDRSGMPLESQTTPTDRAYVIPGTVNATIRAAVCEGEWRTTDGFAQPRDFVNRVRAQ